MERPDRPLWGMTDEEEEDLARELYRMYIIENCSIQEIEREYDMRPHKRQSFVAPLFHRYHLPLKPHGWGAVRMAQSRPRRKPRIRVYAARRALVTVRQAEQIIQRQELCPVCHRRLDGGRTLVFYDKPVGEDKRTRQVVAYCAQAIEVTKRDPRFYKPRDCYQYARHIESWPRRRANWHASRIRFMLKLGFRNFNGYDPNYTKRRR